MSTNKFTNCHKQLTESDIEAAERRIGFQLPAQLKQHYSVCNGGEPEKRCWKDEKWDYMCLKYFFPIRSAAAAADELEDVVVLEDVLVELSEDSLIPSGFIPFADNWGGDYFCIDKDEGSIYFFAMDYTDDHERGKRYLTSSLTEFIEGLVNTDELVY